ncbi:MICOS complex subunit MIC27 isoform X2 [Morone saxatilis]|uniref:MICOS complex subunit MIC27 isoform X2 n=1 Tax=Morone saxatilis TaxID=34816 RepID=UPI0015E24D07|nr:MICOS complex subunit MIC27 isoform X2 [Morone saxatilis]
MAAKVVIVAVPTVLSIASIRVYTVREAATDGLVTREKLNIYTPLPQSAQPHFAPESPGVIQNGLTTARERIQPFFQAVKGACVSVKKGTVNLYHAGEDVYYYLKDPPPEFLPRFGTITMAGLLGMFLARKGSRFKRVAVPMGLMSAGASVCYPAQAVAVLKVTGKKVYAAGQWSSAAVSSLLTPKPQEPVAKEIAASLPQATTVLNPESSVVEEASEASSASHSSAQSSTIPETEVESVESVPVSDEPIVAVVTKEASSVTFAEISPDQTPTETNTDPVAHAVQAETETTSTPEEIPASIESEEPSQAAKDVSTDTSPAESTLNLEPETTESAPVAVVPVEVAPVEPALDESAPAESAPAESAPAESAPAESGLDESAPVESASAESAEVESAPAESAEVESAPSSEELPAPKSSDEPAVPVVESAEPDPDSAPQPELADPTQVAAVEETLNPTLTPQPPQQPAVENRTGGSGFKPDPAVMDFGQSNPEDEDLYSTRS